MLQYFKKLLSDPFFYHYSRQALLWGMPLKKWAQYGNYDQPRERIADLGCGPSDILRYVDESTKPAFYLGIDISARYLKQASSKAKKLNLYSKFISLDLSDLSTQEAIQSQLIAVLNEHHITTVNLFGVMHHLDDLAVIHTLNTVFAAGSVRSLITQDVLIIKGNRINNFYVSLDRGEYVRTEQEYDDMINKTKWGNKDKMWSQAGVGQVKYIHYRLRK